MRECFSSAVAAPPVLYSGQTLGWEACMLMTKVRKYPWGVRRITFSGPLAAEGVPPPRFREQVMNTSWGRYRSHSVGRLFDCEGVDRADRCFDRSVSFIWVKVEVLRHVRCYFQQALSLSRWDFLQTW